MKKMYIVSYSTGSYDSWEEYKVFITKDKEKAKKYCDRFNRLVVKWRRYWSELTESVIEQEDWVYDRYQQFSDFNRCYIKEIEVR